MQNHFLAALSVFITLEIFALSYNSTNAAWAKTPEKQLFLQQSLVTAPIFPDCGSFNYDFQTDSSITKFVSPQKPLNNISYAPNDLVKISKDHFILYENQYLRADAAQAINQLGAEYEKFFGHKLTMTSSYRGFQEQSGLYNAKNANKNIVAKPGTSEHQLGLAADIIDQDNQKLFKTYPQSSAYYQWLSKNAYRFGFVQSYQGGNEGYDEESWHRRYVGKSLAMKLRFERVSYTTFFQDCKIM